MGSSPGPTCRIARVLEELPDATADRLAGTLADRGPDRLKNTDLSDLINAADDVPGGLKPVSAFVVGYHRRGRCRCAEARRPARRDREASE